MRISWRKRSGERKLLRKTNDGVIGEPCNLNPNGSISILQFHVGLNISDLDSVLFGFV